MALGVLKKVLAELGLVSLWNSSADTKLLISSRFVRMFGYGGGPALILVAYLSALGISTQMIGLFMTLTLVGDVIFSFILTLFADALGRKSVLAMGAIMVAGSGVVFALSGNYWVLLLGAIVGIISPSGNEIGPFRAIEESTLAQLTASADRGDIYAWYSLLGTAGQAFGMMVSGWAIQYMRSELRWGSINVYRAVFWGYAALGLLKLCLSLCLSKAVEAERKPHLLDQETAPLLGDSNLATKPKKTFRSLLPDIKHDSWAIVINLCLLLGLDAFASGLVPLSWVTYFFKSKFEIAEGKLGSIFFVASFISALSMLMAASLAKRIGNIKTMVFTHLPSSVLLALLPVPSSLPLALTFLFLRSSTASMDMVPRVAFIAAVLRPSERTAVMGLINVVKTFASTLGPSITGILAEKKLFWVSFVMAGSLKITYDLGMLAVFAGYKTADERDEEARIVEEAERPRPSEDGEEP